MNVKNREQLLIIVTITAVVLLGGDRFVLSPLIASWKERSAKIVELEKNVAHGKQVLERAGSVERKWQEYKSNTLSNDVSVAENQLLKAFDRWSLDSRISISAIKPQWKRAEDYQTLECRVDAFGSLATLTRFLHNIEKDPLAIKVDAVEIGSRDNTGSQLTLGLLVSGLSLGTKER